MLERARGGLVWSHAKPWSVAVVRQAPTLEPYILKAERFRVVADRSEAISVELQAARAAAVEAALAEAGGRFAHSRKAPQGARRVLAELRHIHRSIGENNPKPSRERELQIHGPDRIEKLFIHGRA